MGDREPKKNNKLAWIRTKMYDVKYRYPTIR